ncbi:3-methyl-2-oxobutanoate hydroxymethyltransferase, partial [Clavibacter michiganensis]|uniref:3-methyl-2-oxobutanoate hydroxymethyltransferase n=1 Tax=Clavibacter michiganensis TaxID=28447 RepID=UPI00292EC7D5
MSRGSGRRAAEDVRHPTVGIGAGNGTDGQILVGTDFAGPTSGRVPRFVRRYADMRAVLLDAATRYRDDVASGTFPA